MRIALRVDSAAVIGIGHLMRCLALADELAQRGHHCQFITRAHHGAYLKPLQQRSFKVSLLPPPAQPLTATSLSNQWLATTSAEDLAATCDQLQEPPDWLIVDHYGIDQQWLTLFRQRQPHSRILAIDDLADRPLDADLLLNQTVGIGGDSYQGLLPHHCRLLLGTPYMLLRPQFRNYRQQALSRRQSEVTPRRLLISLGGTDPAGLTLPLVERIVATPALAALSLDILLSSAAPALPALHQFCLGQPRLRLHIDSDEVAALLTNADLAIGAAGSSAWERCCLGVPTIQLVLADNQRQIAQQLDHYQAALTLDHQPGQGVVAQILAPLQQLLSDGTLRARLSHNAMALCDGEGCQRVATILESPSSSFSENRP